MKLSITAAILVVTLSPTLAQMDQRDWPFRLMPVLPPGSFWRHPIFPNLCEMITAAMDNETMVQVIEQIDGDERHSFTVGGDGFIHCVDSIGGPDVCRMSNLFDSDFFNCLEKHANSTESQAEGDESDETDSDEADQESEDTAEDNDDDTTENTGGASDEDSNEDAGEKSSGENGEDSDDTTTDATTPEPPQTSTTENSEQPEESGQNSSGQDATTQAADGSSTESTTEQTSTTTTSST